MAIKYTKHAKEMLVLRKVDKRLADQTAENPDKISIGKEGKKVYLKDFGKNYLMLVVSEESGDKIVVTLHWLAKKRVKRYN